MTALEDVREIREASTPSLVGVILIMIASAVGFTLLTAQFDKLLGTGGGALPAAIHGLVAFLYLFVRTIGLYLGWRLLTGHIRAFADLQLLAWWPRPIPSSPSASGLAIHLLPRSGGGQPALVLREEHAGGAQDILRVQGIRCALHAAARGRRGVHSLAVGCSDLERPWLRYSVAVLMGLAFFYLVIAFGLGAAVTKLRPA